MKKTKKELLSLKIAKLEKEILKIPVKCNKCGGSCLIKEAKQNYGLINALVHGGYHSLYLEDCSTYKFSMCEKCLHDLFDSFKIKAQVEEN